MTLSLSNEYYLEKIMEDTHLEIYRLVFRDVRLSFTVLVKLKESSVFLKQRTFQKTRTLLFFEKKLGKYDILQNIISLYMYLQEFF